MAGAEYIEIISALVAIGALILAVWTNNKAAKRADVSALQETICTLQVENKRLSEKILRIEGINEERGLRITGLEVLLREATAGRIERSQYIRVLESDNDALRIKIKALEKEIP